VRQPTDRSVIRVQVHMNQALTNLELNGGGTVMGIPDIVNKYASAPQPGTDTASHFDQVAAASAKEDLGAGLASMFRSASTAPFGQSVGSLFDQSNPTQRAGVLNQIVQSLGPSALSAGGGILGRLLGHSAPASAAAPPTITPEQASKISPADVTVLASHAEQHNPSVVDSVSSFYAQHPTLVKTLGVAALAVAMGHMRQ